jgi:hypothetical protein
MHITGVRWDEEKITHIEVNENGVPVSLREIYYHTAETVDNIKNGKNEKSQRPFYVLLIAGEPLTLFVREAGHNEYHFEPETRQTIATLKKLRKI